MARPIPTTDNPEHKLLDIGDEDLRRAATLTPSPQFTYAPSQAEINFAREFALHGDLQLAYRLTQPLAVTNTLTPAQVRAKASHLLSTDRVDERYDYYRTLLAARMDIREDRILSQLASIAFADPADFYEEDGRTLKNVHTIPPHARAAMDSFETGYTKDGPYSKMKMNSKQQALNKLVEIKNMAADANAAKAPTIKITLDQSTTITNEDN